MPLTAADARWLVKFVGKKKIIKYYHPISFVDKQSFDRQLNMGLKVEMEHTDNPKIARRIALDHLREYPDYYTRLKRCVEIKKLKKVL